MTVRRLFSVGVSTSRLARLYNAYKLRLVNADVDYEPSVGPIPAQLPNRTLIQERRQTSAGGHCHVKRSDFILCSMS